MRVSVVRQEKSRVQKAQLQLPKPKRVNDACQSYKRANVTCQG